MELKDTDLFTILRFLQKEADVTWNKLCQTQETAKLFLRIDFWFSNGYVELHDE
jgi:hypothetical protein